MVSMLYDLTLLPRVLLHTLHLQVVILRNVKKVIPFAYSDLELVPVLVDECYPQPMSYHQYKPP